MISVQFNQYLQISINSYQLDKRKYHNPAKPFNVEHYYKLTLNRFCFLVWIKKVEAAKWEAQRPSEKNELKHIERISEAEKERFALVKQIGELELSTQQFSSVLEQAVIKNAQLKESNEKSKKLTISPIE